MAVPICSMPCLENLSLLEYPHFQFQSILENGLYSADSALNVENTEIFDFLKLRQDCKQVAIRVYQTCPLPRHAINVSWVCAPNDGHACCSKQPMIQRPKAGSANELENGHVQPNAENI